MGLRLQDYGEYVRIEGVNYPYWLLKAIGRGEYNDTSVMVNIRGGELRLEKIRLEQLPDINVRQAASTIFDTMQQESRRRGINVGDEKPSRRKRSVPDATASEE